MRYLILFAALLMGCWDSGSVMLQEVVMDDTPTRPKVRMVYVGHDEPSVDVLTCIAEDLRALQWQFADEMERHGYGRKTFDVFSDAQGDMIIEWIPPLYPDATYAENTYLLWDEINARLAPMGEWPDQEMGVHEIRLHFVNLDPMPFCGFGARARHSDDGWAYLSWACWGGGEQKVGTSFDHWDCTDYKTDGRQWRSSIVAHELGHAFGLPHDFRSGEYVMSYGHTKIGDNWVFVDHPQSRLSAASAAILNQHRAFGPVQLQIVPGR